MWIDFLASLDTKKKIAFINFYILWLVHAACI